ncbi:hypothetical protein XH94_30530 [Bradyrhizobium zhanjiangense]|uniref:Uncharacterized protein n=1 Tax=Bradyrhizobium zhanjiangense TaxID=1325107 RepID=A0A4Q0SAK3_9BRAD|nr:hypothetical protein XH94_30530 [Bradyrhizobium zhanjiangense]
MASQSGGSDERPGFAANAAAHSQALSGSDRSRFRRRPDHRRYRPQRRSRRRRGRRRRAMCADHKQSYRFRCK